ncbi:MULTISPECIES: hypothetical protein [unclassified Chitinophaga]|nr:MULTISPECIES: hypothetical protein [unclassified Chitinophaga]WPV64504.1 hypothetical protein QQL36_22125 [Chitinophaga sp. LS1]
MKNYKSPAAAGKKALFAGAIEEELVAVVKERFIWQLNGPAAAGKFLFF